MKSVFYKKNGVEYLSKEASFYGGKLRLEDDMKVENLDMILDIIDDYTDILETVNMNKKKK